MYVDKRNMYFFVVYFVMFCLFGWLVSHVDIDMLIERMFLKVEILYVDIKGCFEY